MTSAIDATKPIAGSPTTQSVRDNFSTAASEITSLQANGIEALTTAEVDQLENIGTTTISAAQWVYLGASDQALATSDSITHVNFTATGYYYSSITDSITAGTTQTQAGATALTTQVNRVTVSGTNGDGVKLPTAVAGARVLIINADAAQTIQIWPNTSDTIDSGSADAVDSNTLAAGAEREYVANDTTNWDTITPTGGSGDLVSTNNLSDVASATTSATNLGLGTGDSPQFTGIELGHATDTTLTRASAGDVDIEGNAIYRAGGTDVPVADGGTGASTLTDGGVLLGSGTGAITAMSVLADGEMIVGDGTTDPVAESGATLRTSIGVAIGSDVQAYDVDLTELATGYTSEGATTAATFKFLEGTNNGTNGVTLAGAASTADVTVTLPAATDTLVGKATTDTFTNKTFDANGTGNSLSNVDIADLANGTDGELITWDSAGAPAAVAVGTDGQFLQSNGAGAAPTFEDVAAGGFTLTAETATTSGSSATIGSVPAGTKVIYVLFNDVSLSGTDNIFVQIGDSGGLESSGYLAHSHSIIDTTVGRAGGTDGFYFDMGNAAYALNGWLCLTLQDSTNFQWEAHGGGMQTADSEVFCSGDKALSAELTQVSIGTSGSNTLDGGAFALLYS